MRSSLVLVVLLFPLPVASRAAAPARLTLVPPPAITGETFLNPPATAPSSAPGPLPAIVTSMPTTAPALYLDRPAFPATRSAATSSYGLEELIGMLRQGQSQEVLRYLAHYQPNPKAASHLGKYDIFMLKAEALLQTKSTAGARDLFALAAKEAPDATAKAYPYAMEQLIRRSTGLKYTPKPSLPTTSKPATKPIPYDLLDYAQRHAALTALFIEEAQAEQVSLTQAMAARNLPRLAQAVQTLSELDLLERAATGSNTQVRQAKNEMAVRIASVINDNLRASSNEAKVLAQQANQVLAGYTNAVNPDGRTITSTTYRRRGMTPEISKRLRALGDDCDRIAPATGEFATHLEVDSKSFGKVTENAAKVSQQIRDALLADYSVPPTADEISRARLGP